MAVSYKHLFVFLIVEVAKQKELQNLSIFIQLCASCVECQCPVSYTHLDVYKRQSKTDVLTWVDLIRERAGFEGVEESWDTYTNNKKYETVDGRREIIQQERGIRCV